MHSRVFGSTTSTADKHATAGTVDSFKLEKQEHGKKGLRSVLGFSSSSVNPNRRNPSESSPAPSNASSPDKNSPLKFARTPSRHTLTKENKHQYHERDFTSVSVSAGSRRSADVERITPPSSYASTAQSLSSATGRKARQQTSIRDGRTSITEFSFFQSPSSPSPASASLPPTPKRQQPSLLPSTSEPAPSPADQSTVTLNSPDRKIIRPEQKQKLRSRKTMKQEMLNERAGRKKLARLEPQDGPWSVSVAESPYDHKQFSVYIKSESLS